MKILEKVASVMNMTKIITGLCLGVHTIPVLMALLIAVVFRFFFSIIDSIDTTSGAAVPIVAIVIFVVGAVVLQILGVGILLYTVGVFVAPVVQSVFVFRAFKQRKWFDGCLHLLLVVVLIAGIIYSIDYCRWALVTIVPELGRTW